MLIPQIEKLSLDVTTATASESSSRSHFAIPFSPVFDPSQYVKREDFDRLKTKTAAFMEQTAKNQENIQTTLSLFLVRLTNQNL